MTYIKPKDTVDSRASLMNIPQTLRALTWLALIYTYGHLLFTAFFRFGITFDFLAYHLPGALRLVGLTTFEPGPKMSLVLAGFPPLAHFTQGALVWLTGFMSGSTAHSALLFVFVCLILKRQYGRAFSLQWFLTLCLAIPLFIMHFSIGYIDLFSGLMLMLTFVGLDVLGKAENPREFRQGSIFYALAGSGAMLCKLQAWPIVFFATLFFIGLVLKRFLDGSLPLKAALTILLLTGTGLSIWPLRNIIYYGNPTYPFSAPFMKEAFSEAPIALNEDEFRLQLPQPLWEKPLGYRFLFSLFEVNRFMAPGYTFSYDQNAQHGHQSIHHRMGGFFPITVVSLLLISIAAYRRKLVSGSAMGGFIVSILFLMNFLPANHELRYWFFIPLTLGVWTARYLTVYSQDPLSKGVKCVLFGCAVYFCATIPHLYDYSKPQDVTDWSHPAAQQFWATASKDEQAIVCGAIPYAIYWSGPTFNQYPVKDRCL